MCMMGSSFRHSLGRASMVYRGSKQQILDWALESTKTWFNCLFEWLIFLHLYGVSLSTVFLVLYLNISSLLPSCHYSTTMHRTSNGNGLYQNNCRRPRLQPSFQEDWWWIHQGPYDHIPHDTERCPISQAGVKHDGHTWHWTMSYFAISMHDPCQYIYLLVLVITAQPAKTSGPHTNSSTAVAPLSVPLYSWRCQGRSMLHATHNCPGLEEIIDAGEEKAPGASFLL